MSNFDLFSYDHYIVYFSGGKDSVACLLWLIDQGVDLAKVELWHHDVDGKDGHFMDWPITHDYCKRFAEAFELPIYYSWKVGGFKREMLRENSKTAPSSFETPDGEVITLGGNGGKASTRRKFPQVSADLSVRWCSAYLKVDVAAMAIRNQARFEGKRVLTISGERAEESTARSKYAIFEPDRADNRNGKKTVRTVDRLRPVHGWDTSQVWEIIKAWSVNPHPAYKLGWGRVSCLHCIFGSNNQCASQRIIDPQGFNEIALYEDDFGVTIDRKLSITERADLGTPYAMDEEQQRLAMAEAYTDDIFINEWTLPAGAFAESCGPI